MQAKSLSAGQGASWFSCGWELFKQDFGTWFIMFLIFIGLSIVLNFVPFIGPLALMIISPALMAGFMYAAAELDQGNKIEIGYLFQGFRDKERMNKLLVLGVVYLLVQVFIIFIMFTVVGGSMMMSASQTGNVDPAEIMTAGMGISMLLIILVALVIMMGFIYSTQLVMLDNMAPIESIKASYAACFKNILPLLVFGLIYFLLAIVAAIPLFLGFLILIPVSFTALYCSYKSIFH
jgi:uncharacterized membrane protein